MFVIESSPTSKKASHYIKLSASQGDLKVLIVFEELPCFFIKLIRLQLDRCYLCSCFALGSWPLYSSTEMARLPQPCSKFNGTNNAGSYLTLS